MYFSEINTLD